MATDCWTPMSKAQGYVERCVRRFAHRPDVVAVIDDWVSSEACFSFALGYVEYATALVSLAIESLEKLHLSPDRADLKSTLNWLNWCLRHFQRTQPPLSSQFGTTEARWEDTDLKAILCGIADQVLRDEYWLSNGEGAQSDTQATRRVLFPNFLSDAFTPTGDYIAGSSVSTHLLPYPGKLFRLCRDSRLIETCGILLNELDKGTLNPATVRKFVRTKHLVEAAMLDTVLVHLAAPILSCAASPSASASASY
jgi:hypothetical protein